MTVYSYADPGGSDIIVALKIEQAGLPLPDGMQVSGGQLQVLYSAALSPAQELSLNAVVATANVGDILPTANSVYTFDDPLDNRAGFNAALSPFGLSVTVWPTDATAGHLKFIFNKILTNQDKNNVKTALLSLLKQIQ